MTHAQKIYLASILLLRRIRAAGIEVPLDITLEFYCRVERWCAEAQCQERG